MWCAAQMGTTGAWFTALDRILRTMQGKCFWRAPSRAGAQSTHTYIFVLSAAVRVVSPRQTIGGSIEWGRTTRQPVRADHVPFIRRCNAPHDDPDTGQHARRSHKLTAALLESGLSTRQLWDDHGIVSYLTPFTAYFPRADIHELLAPDLLHQRIKGTFKDHLVTWVEEYLINIYGKAGAAKVMADIDRRIASVPSFPGLCRFPEGRGFKQWTGDDSKALMKVYLPAIAGHVPGQVIRAFRAFLDFCSLVRRVTIDEDTIADQISEALDRFHRERKIFETTGVRESISYPRQHAVKHCPFLAPPSNQTILYTHLQHSRTNAVMLNDVFGTSCIEPP
ncbi:hypothetical protein OH76DRAFT_602905 [Lentinus brumalis]|uniref:Uncharacterized protein n=1 Tax=Lentinus brumalis TaxID=2498619 RepID=A0A371DUF4_9APHY|nr:hypothetical protein OH76DRAFT_602905 [Polyporus brumalis]